MDFKFPSNPNQSTILWFCDNARAFRAALIIPRKIALPGHRRPFSLFQMLWLRWVGEAQSFPGGAGGFSHTICFEVQGSRAAKAWPAAPVCGLSSLQHLLVWWALWNALWVALNFPHKKKKTIIAGSRLVNTELAELLWALPCLWPSPATSLIASIAGWGHSSRNPPDPYPNTPQTLPTLQILYKISCLIRLLYHSRAWV